MNEDLALSGLPQFPARTDFESSLLFAPTTQAGLG